MATGTFIRNRCVSTTSKTCSFDCIYCQLGHTRHPLTERQVLICQQINRPFVHYTLAEALDEQETRRRRPRQEVERR